MRQFFPYFAFILLLASCSHSSIVGNQQALEELERLGSLNQAGTITEDDLATLQSLVGSDHEAEHNIEELTLMVRFKETAHTDHAIAFFSAYIQSGEETLCPGHDLAHFYVLTRHGETEVAEHALEEAQDDLKEWERAARSYTAQYPAPQTVDDVKANIEAHLARIASGNTQATEEEERVLATESLCVTE